MKKVIFILSLFLAIFATTSCEKDECLQDCYLQEVYGTANSTYSLASTVKICHYDAATQSYVTLEVDESGLQGHANHPNDDLTGECQSLAIEDYNLGPAKAWKIPCGYDQETIIIDGTEYYITYRF